MGIWTDPSWGASGGAGGGGGEGGGGEKELCNCEHPETQNTWTSHRRRKTETYEGVYDSSVSTPAVGDAHCKKRPEKRPEVYNQRSSPFSTALIKPH